MVSKSPDRSAAVAGATARRVLVVEDDPVSRLVITRLLEHEGVEVDAVGGGDEAVRAVRKGGYAAVFMDCDMPGVDGLEATRRIRAAETGDRVAIVALSGHVDAPDRERCRTAGMDDHVAKPIASGELRRVLDRWIPGGAQLGPLLDVPLLARLRGDFDDGTRARLLELFVAGVPEEIERLRTAVADGDGAGLRAHAHRVKGSCLNLGAERMRGICERLERLGEEGRPSEAPALIDELEAAFAATREDLRSALVGT